MSTTRFPACPSSTCTTPTMAGGRGPNRLRTTVNGSPGIAPRNARAAPRPAQRARVARLDGRATAQLDDAARARHGLGDVDPGSRDWQRLRKHAVHLEYMTIYRPLADPAYLDLTIDPDDRPLGSLFAAPDPFDANYGR